MDIISFNEASTANGRIEKIVSSPDSDSGIVTQPSVIASGETITVPSGRMAVLPNLQVDGELVIDGEVFVPSGATVGDLEDQIAAVDGRVDATNIVVDSKAPLANPALTGTPTVNGVAFSGYSGFKNYIINGNFDVWQYGTSQTSSGYGSDDRWNNYNLSSTKTHSQVACTDTERALFNASKFSRTVVVSVAGASNRADKFQHIEDVTKLAGKTVTISFWAKADAAKNIAIELKQTFGSGGSPSASGLEISAQLVALTTTWQKKTITVTLPSIVGKTLGTDGIHTTTTALRFWFDAGSDYNSRTANLGQQSGTFDIAQVQLEEGSVATPFENRPYGLELSLCQRYYERTFGTISSVEPGSVASAVYYSVNKRVVPSIEHSNISENANFGTVTINNVNLHAFKIYATTNSTNDSYLSQYFNVNAEL